MTTIRVPLGERSYAVHLGAGLRRRVAELLPASHTARGRRFLLAADTAVPESFSSAVAKSLSEAGARAVDAVQVPSGEASKCVAVLAALWDAAAAARLDRGDVMVAIGGGVAGDVVGFAAATYMRGIAFVQMPTTVLAMVDSSVGGKTGINLDAGKNLVGAVHQPIAVIADTDALATLPIGEHRSGLAEVVKAAVLADAELFARLAAEPAALLDARSAALATAMARAIGIKADVVSRDEHERGERAVLNLGHTIGHALEAELGYGTIRHGEAVAVGMIAEGHIATALGTGWTAEDQRALEALLRAIGLPIAVALPEGPDPVIARTALDKKARGGEVRYALPHRIGHATPGHPVPAEAARAALRRVALP
jgi:3-dehydroquinate synthase